MTKRLIALLILIVASPVFAANHYVRQGAGGTGTGADWANACTGFTGSCAIASLVRGDTYYVATGSYGSLTLNKAASGSALITIQGATAASHGTATGWVNTYSVSSADGGAHASFGGLEFNSSFWLVDGAVGSGTTTNSYGFTITQGCGAVGIGVQNGTYTTISVSHIYALACASDSEKLFLQTNSQTGQIDNVTVSNSLLDGWQNGVMARGNPGVVDNNWVFTHNICLNGFSSSANHGEWINPNSAGLNNITVSFNVFRGHSGSSGMTGTIVANNSDNTNAKIYGNVFDGLQVGNGVITGTSAGNLNNAVVYNNTFLNMTSDSGNAIGGTGQGSGNTARNNLFYNTSASQGGSFTFDYNAYFSTTNTPTEAHGQIASGNPFVSSIAGDYHLSLDTATWTTLLSPYNVDPDGVTRTTSRGAFQFAVAPAFTTWYIRTDGGTRWDPTHTSGQCDGSHNAPYPGSGVDQPCAFNDVRWLWDNQNFGNYPNWIISGGDTVILQDAAAAWRVGFQGNGTSTDPWCFGGNGPINCIMPAIPGGTPANPTRFWGENHGSCSTTRTIMTVNGPRVQQIPDVAKTTKLWGGHGEFVVLNATGPGDVDVQCLDISSFEPACQLQGSPQTNPCNRSPPVSDYSSDGIETSNGTGNLVFQDIYMHGMNSRGFHGQQGIGTTTANRVWVSIIPQTCYDFDDSSASGTGAFSLTNSILEACGWQQLNSPPNYPPLSDAQLFQNIGVGYSQGSGNVIGDGIGTPGGSGFPVFMDSDIFQWSTQDGEDFGHMDTGSFAFTLNNSVSQHNSGQTFKNGWAFNNVQYLNDIALADCARMAAGNQLPGGVPLTVNQYIVDSCRAGDNYSINFQHATQMTTANNTIVGSQPTFFDYKCVDSGNNCSAAVWNMNNNIILAYSNPSINQGIAPADFCGAGCNDSIGAVGTVNRQNNIFFNLRNCSANQLTPGATNGSSTNEQCTSPLLINQPANPVSSFNSLDNFNYNLSLSPASPAIGGGVTYSGILPLDYGQSPQTNPPVIGALVPGGTPPPPTIISIAVTPNPGAVLVGGTLQMICTATKSDFSTLPCPSTVWSGTNAHSTINSTGLVTGTSGGADTITANSSGFNANATVNVSALPIVATPTSSPAPGSYPAAQTVTLLDATSGATICYRIDGPTPTAPTAGTCGAGSLTYTTPISVAVNTTFVAIGTKAGSTNSSPATLTYTISSPPLMQLNGTFGITGTFSGPP